MMRYEITILLHTELDPEDLVDRLMPVLPTNASIAVQALDEEGKPMK